MKQDPKVETTEPCPECGGNDVRFDKGEPMTRDYPGDPPAIYCNDCGYSIEASAEECQRYGR